MFPDPSVRTLADPMNVLPSPCVEGSQLISEKK